MMNKEEILKHLDAIGDLLQDEDEEPPRSALMSAFDRLELVCDMSSDLANALGVTSEESRIRLMLFLLQEEQLHTFKGVVEC